MRRIVWPAVLSAIILTAALAAWITGLLVTDSQESAQTLALVGIGMAVLALRDR